jgi:hypothetical protein
VTASPICSKRFACTEWKINGREKRFGIEVIFSRLIDDAQVCALSRASVWNNLIDLAALEIFAIVILKADDKLWLCFYVGHAEVSPKSV